MPASQTIVVQNKFDIVEARMRVRRLAREVGFDLFDQARISLATSTLATILEMEHAEQGQIAMDHLEKDLRIGVKVICSNPNALLHGFGDGVLDDARRMVDDLTIAQLPSQGVEVTLIKWANARNRWEIAEMGDNHG